MSNALDPDRMTDGDPKHKAVVVLKPPRKTTCKGPATYLKLSPESPSLPRRGCPDGVRRPKREHVPDACLRPNAERQGLPDMQERRGLAAQVVEQLAQLIVGAHERNSSTT